MTKELKLNPKASPKKGETPEPMERELLVAAIQKIGDRINKMSENVKKLEEEIPDCGEAGTLDRTEYANWITSIDGTYKLLNLYQNVEAKLKLTLEAIENGIDNHPRETGK